MVQTVKLEDGSFHTFPDDATPDEMEAALQEHSPIANNSGVVSQSQANSPLFSDLPNEDQENAMSLARQKISQQYPNLPPWVRDMMLSVTPKNKSPRLEAVANEMQKNTNSFPVAAGGLLQGVATPFQGITSFIPGKIAQDFTNEDFTRYFPQPQNSGENLLQGGAKITGGLGGLGKLFGALKGVSQAAKIPKILQNAVALSGTGALATPGDAYDKTLGGVGALALGGAGRLGTKVVSAGTSKLGELLRGLTNESTPESLVNAVQRPHDILQNTANTLYDYVKDAIKNRGISTPVNSDYLKQAQEILPKTRASKQLIKAAESGDYDAVHDLQSHLYRKGTSALSSDDIALQNQGDEILDLRSKINDELKSNLIKSGHLDVAHVLDQAKSTYKNLMDTYFDKNLPKGIQKMVHPGMRLVPENPEQLFMQKSVPMERFLNKHPEVARHVQGIKEKEAAKNALGKILTNTAKVGGIGYVGSSILDLLK